MKSGSCKYIYILLLVFIPACKPAQTQWIPSAFSCGVLSTQVEAYSNKEITLKIRFFVLDKEESDQLTKRDVENNLSLYSSDVDGVLTDFKEVNTSAAGMYSCTVLLDDVYNIINFDYFRNYSSTEIFLRKFFKNMGEKNSVRFSIFKNQNPPVTIYGKGVTNNAREMDLLLADLLNNPVEPASKFHPLPLLQSIDALLDTINSSASWNNRNLLLVYSRNSFIKTGVTKESIIVKAKNLGIKVSTIIDYGGEYHIDYDLSNEDIFYKLAYETGGFVYKNNDALSGEEIYILSSQLGNIFEGNFKCYETTWKITPSGSWTNAFQPGFFTQGDIEVELQTGYDKKAFNLPFGIIIK